MFLKRRVCYKSNREIRENREQKKGVSLVVPFSWVFQKGVSVVGQRIFNREMRENREQKKGVSPVGWRIFRELSVSFVPSKV